MASPIPTMRITVNGHEHDIDASPETPLLYILRNDLHLNAAKFGCGLGRCGTCTVHLDGEAVHACMVPVADVVGKNVTTLEGLGDAGDLHPLQQAFLDEQAAQCGYCAPGIIMTAVAFLKQDPQPSGTEIRHALRGTLCRCGSHPRMLRAIRRMIETGGA